MKDGFSFILKTQGFEVSLSKRNRSESVTKIAALSNRSRNYQGFEESQFEGREFVMDNTGLDDFGAPVRGDVIIWDTNVYNITEVLEMVIFGEIAGYRLRTN